MGVDVFGNICGFSIEWNCVRPFDMFIRDCSYSFVDNGGCLRVCFVGGCTLKGFLIVYWGNDVDGVCIIDDDAERARDDNVRSKCSRRTPEHGGKVGNDDCCW